MNTEPAGITSDERLSNELATSSTNTVLDRHVIQPVPFVVQLNPVAILGPLALQVHHTEVSPVLFFLSNFYVCGFQWNPDVTESKGTMYK